MTCDYFLTLPRAVAVASLIIAPLACGGAPDANGEEPIEDFGQLVTPGALVPVADAYVDEQYPKTNYGSSAKLVADTSPRRRAYLRFAVSGLSGPPTKAVLRLYVSGGTTNAPRVFATGSSWTESTLNWNNRPAPSGSAIADAGAISASSWLEYDVTPLITGNGEVNVVLVPDVSDTLTLASRESTAKPELVLDTGATTPPPASEFGIAAAPPLSSYLRPGYVVVAKDKIYDGFTSSPFKIDGGQVQGVNANGQTVTVGWADASVQKVLVGLTFKNASVPPIVPKYVRNLLIYGCKFENIRTWEPGTGVHGINAAAGGGGPVDDVQVIASYFNRIGADGIQWGGGTSAENYKWELAYSEFYGPKDLPVSERWGENSWDVKGVKGPIHIHHNITDGFRECVSPKRGGNQDCSGSQGTGAVVHSGSGTGIARNVIMDNNLFRDNKGQGGLAVNECDNVTIGPGHVFQENSQFDVIIGTSQTTNVKISKDQTQIDWTKVVLGNGVKY